MTFYWLLFRQENGVFINKRCDTYMYHMYDLIMNYMTRMLKTAVDCGCQTPLVLTSAIRASHGGSVLASCIIGSLVV